MQQTLRGRKIAILVEEGFEQVELTEPRQALTEAGAETYLISPRTGTVKGWDHTTWGDEFPVEVSLEKARPEAYHALLLPGGVMNPDRLRMNPEAVSFVKSFVIERKPVAVICHGPWTLVEADVVRGRRIASWPSLQTDLRNAGAEWVDQEVQVDGNLLTSRKPDDLPAFMTTLIQAAKDWAKNR